MLRKFLVLALLAVTASALNLPGVPLEFSEDNAVISAISDDIANKFADEFIKFMETGVESASLKQISTQLGKSHTKDIFTTNPSELSAVNQFFTCTTCRAVANVVARTFRSDEGELNGPNAQANTKMVVLALCDRLKIQTQEVCSGLFDLYWDMIHYIIMNSNGDARSMCGMLPIDFCQVKQDEFNWQVKVDSTKGPMTAPKSAVPQKTDNDLTIVQLTDIHYDNEYQVGSLADCEEPMCCRVTPASGLSDEAKAGYWSDYRNCDSPLHMIKDAFDNVKVNHPKIDYIYQTGDIVPHLIWATTKEGNKAMLTEINDLIAEKFPGIPVYPIVGNHEPHPTNVFGHKDIPAEMTVDWLYEHLWSNWQRWLPAETKETILKGGYYTVSPKPGFRIIALNNNDCYLFNFWIFYDGSATAQPQLDWLHDTLLAAEKAGEKVHILAHIPSGSSDCWSVWAREYNRIIERFSDTISAIFNGHTHRDEMILHHSANGHPMAISWNGGSLTSYSYKNPNYRSYEVEPATYQVVDHSTYFFNLTEANQHGDHRSPLWSKEYQFSEFTNDLSPAGIDALFEKMAENPEILRKMWQYQHISADPKLQSGCSDKCMLNTICRLVTSEYGETTRCKQLKAKLSANLGNEKPTEGTPTSSVAPPQPTEDPNGDGAASITASITSIVAMLYVIKQMLF
ncbi:sphingomyelin phosphodiesterase 1-like [Musca autumnalis]|uniref:sphingomyelin phosphodiesterase 1-like n=1 Tax=Musca autumnalis TaxID=221902 RepID=UPI003CF3C360